MANIDVGTNVEQISLLGNASVTVTNVAGATLYYADNNQVSSTSNQGSLTAGNSATFTEAIYVISASRTTINTTWSTGTGAVTTVTTPGDKSTATSQVEYRGAQLKVVYEVLNALDGYLTPNSALDQSSAMQSFWTTVVNASGAGYLPQAGGPYHMGSTAIVSPSSNSASLFSDDNSGWMYPLVAGGGAVLQWDGEVSATNAPETVAAFQLLGKQRLSNLRFVGPGGLHGGVSGVRPCASAGIQVADRTHLDAVTMTYWGAAFLVGNPPNNVFGDHWWATKIGIDQCGFGFFTPSNSLSGGDVHLREFQISVTLACIAQAAKGATTWQGGEIVSGGLYAPYAFMRWEDGLATSGGTWLDSMSLMANIESPGNGCFYDETALSAHKGSIAHCWFYPGMLGNIVGGVQWGASAMTVTAQATTSLSFTAPTNLVIRPGMTVTDSGSLYPAGTYITAITAGTWTAGSAVTYTVTTNNAPSSALTPGTTTVTVNMPKIGKIVAGAVTENVFLPKFTSSTFPILAAQQVQHNQSLDAVDILTSAQGPGVCAWPTGAGGNTSVSQCSAYGNDWGSAKAGGVRLTSISAGVAVAQYDVVEQIPINANTSPGAQPAGHTANVAAGPVLGVAQNAATTSQVVDVMTSNWKTTVNNKSVSGIADKAFIKPDYANPGGVTTATGLTDGPAIGVAIGAIAAGATGNAQLFIS